MTVLVFLATKFYNEYSGSARSNLVTIGAHEIAHQWWFGLAGSDQALEPWLDEALLRAYAVKPSFTNTSIPARSIGGGSSA
ncbi:MAG: hypothetical protein MZV64_00150 [Ignavibacteriales bacterium]|nr:hypothetical protein [Ignavibacteriales bacterium]